MPFAFVFIKAFFCKNNLLPGISLFNNSFFVRCPDCAKKYFLLYNKKIPAFFADKYLQESQFMVQYILTCDERSPTKKQRTVPIEMTKIFDGLNEKQKEAVLDTEGYVLVFAGAGSGKTKVLTSRIAYLVQEKRVSPSNILAITFTNKAADEMKTRLVDMLGDIGGMWVSTIHSMCVKILRSNVSRLEGYDANFSIYSDIDKTNVIKRILQSMSLEADKYLKNAKFHISDCKNKDISPADFKRTCLLPDAGTYAQIYYAYEEELKRSNAFDFDDLLVKTYHLLDDDSAVREYYSQKFRYIHIDEFQDTNEIQMSIARLLCAEHGNLFVVGDDDQSIYGWRGAEIKNILDFERTFRGAKVHKLEQNYRSTKNILKLANKIIAGNSVRKQKELWTDNDEGEKVEIKIAPDGEEEATYVALKIRQAINQGMKAGDFAVLMRVNALSRGFEQEFIKYGIPYKVFGGFKFFERKEIKDLAAYFRVLTNPLDNESLLRIINVPKRGIGDKTVDALRAYAADYNLSIFDGLCDVNNLPLSAGVKNKLTDFRKLISKLTTASQVMPLRDIFAEVVEKTAFLSQFDENTEENYGKKMNVSEFQNSIEEFAKLNDGATLSDYLNSITLSSDTDEIEDGNFVSVATIHAVKGLEFPTVFVCGLEEGIFPLSRAQDSLSDMEEERRLMYVAITRAEKKLYLTRAQNRFLYGKRQYMDQSVFLKEIAPKAAAAEQQRRPSYDPFGDDYGDNSYGSRGGYKSSGYNGGYNGGYSGSYGGSSYGEKSGYRSNNGTFGRRADDYVPDYGSNEGTGYSGYAGSGGFSSGGAKKMFQSTAKPALQKSTGKDMSAYRPGVKVKHIKFGEGTVISVSGEGKNFIAVIAFPGVGIKSLAVAYAPMDVIK